VRRTHFSRFVFFFSVGAPPAVAAGSTAEGPGADEELACPRFARQRSGEVEGLGEELMFLFLYAGEIFVDFL